LKPLRDVIGERVILMDGAIATELYDHGVFVNRSYDELCVSNPKLVKKVHTAYRKAGAEMLTTNTFGANRLRLRPYGMEERVEEITRAGVRLARAAAGDGAWVAGSIGPTGHKLAPLGKLSPGQAYSVFLEQASAMADEGVDAFLLETFSNLNELWQAFRAVKSVANGTPIIACLSFHHDLDGTQATGPNPEDAARTISNWGADVIGVNCSNGPKTVLQVVERMRAVTDTPIAASPNAGLPQVVDGRSIYMAGPEYMAEYARRFVLKGAMLVGGCCGTTPATVRQMRSFVKSVAPSITHTPIVEANSKADAPAPTVPTPIMERSSFAKKLYSGKFCISVELDPPRGLDPSKALDGAKFLQDNGIDVVNIADGPRAIARMGPGAMANLVHKRCGMESVIHVCCRDRNILGLQMDLIGAHALGQHNILAVTGDPPKMGSYPDATAVFDIDSIGLIHFIQMLNRGLDFSGREIGEKTSFFVGAGCNPAHVDLDLEVERFGRKVDAGAEYFFSQPMYDPEVLFKFLERTKGFDEIPFMVGILPLASHKNAEFLHNEVPGMQVPMEIRERLRKATTRKEQRQIGIEIARDTLLMAREHPRIKGAYIYPPFGSYQAVMKVVGEL
jgi:homocysteine S-methyltransferase